MITANSYNLTNSHKFEQKDNCQMISFFILTIELHKKLNAWLTLKINKQINSDQVKISAKTCMLIILTTSKKQLLFEYFSVEIAKKF